MKLPMPAVTLIVFSLLSCEFRMSTGQDLMAGLTTDGDGLSCENVYLSDGNNKISKTSFIYGEKFYLNFEDVRGLSKHHDHTFPGMKLVIVGEAGDTVMRNDDLYSHYTDGMDFSPLLLQSNITVANPIHSGGTYTMYTTIWDKKGEGTYKAQMNFDVVANDKIKIEAQDVSYDEIYLFSEERKVAIADNSAKLYENVYMIVEGVEGFVAEEGKVLAGMSMLAKDAAGEVLLDEPDLLGDSATDISEFQFRIAASAVFMDPKIKNPVRWRVVIWDKKSKRRITATTDLVLN